MLQSYEICERKRQEKRFFLIFASEKNGFAKPDYNLGSILSIMNENATKVFEASYNVWCKQNGNAQFISLIVSILLMLYYDYVYAEENIYC